MGLMVTVNSEKLPFEYYNASASQVNQVLEQIQNDLGAILGNYTWQLECHTGDYRIVAHCPQGRFVDAKGKSPSKALLNFAPARRILAEKHDIEPIEYK